LTSAAWAATANRRPDITDNKWAAVFMRGWV
jgi:hypothetical protein